MTTINLNIDSLEIGEYELDVTTVYAGDLTLLVSHEIDINREGVYDWCYVNGDDREVLIAVDYEATVNITNIAVTDEDGQMISVNETLPLDVLSHIKALIAEVAEQQAEQDDDEVRENEHDSDWSDWEDDCYE